MTLQQIREAVARGWCHPVNEKKVMDVDLAEAISQEVYKELNKTLELAGNIAKQLREPNYGASSDADWDAE